MSIQITTLKVLAGQPHGRASHADVTRSVALLMSSGVDWSRRMQRLAARAPDLSIFCSGYVIRDDDGWQITGAGLAFLAGIEGHVAAAASDAVSVAPDPATNIVYIADLAERRRPASQTAPAKSGVVLGPSACPVSVMPAEDERLSSLMGRPGS